VPALLAAAGHDAVHVIDCGLAGAPDDQVMAKAVEHGRVLLSADTDFGEILARTRGTVPSVVLFRREDRSAESVASVLLANLDVMADELTAGAFVVIGEERLRLRQLPLP
jgi:predicted nuclease of predicted toxin-antitoxin system